MNVTLQNAKSKLSQHQVLATFLAVVAIAISSLFYVATQRTPPLMGSLDNIETLGDTYRREGLKRYLEEKEQLKRKVGNALKRQDNSEVYYAAFNVALYLFPDVLPKEDFERDVAMEDWVPLQKAIEEQPGTEQARIWFEELRANIWNYESASREAPEISVAARQTLKIYESLSHRP